MFSPNSERPQREYVVEQLIAPLGVQRAVVVGQQFWMAGVAETGLQIDFLGARIAAVTEECLEVVSHFGEGVAEQTEQHAAGIANVAARLGRDVGERPAVDAAAADQRDGTVPQDVQVAQRREAQRIVARSEEHTSELQSLRRISYAVFC